MPSSFLGFAALRRDVKRFSKRCVAASVLAVLAAATGCTTTTIVNQAPAEPSPPAPGAACTEDASAVDIQRVKFATVTPTPLVVSTLDEDGVATVWLDAINAIHFGRFAPDGKVLTDVKIASEVQLPGGDAALGALTLAHAGSKYFVAYADAATQSVRYTVLDKDGVGAAPKVIHPATRSVTRGSGTIRGSAPSVKAREGGFVFTWAESLQSGASIMTSHVAVQLFDAEGGSVSKQGILASGLLTFGDVTRAGSRVVATAYRQGQGSVADRVPMLLQASASGDLIAWNEAEIRLPAPTKTGDVRRASPTVLGAEGGGSIFVDVAGYDTEKGSVERIEIAWLDDLATVTKSELIDLDPTAGKVVSAPFAKLADGTLYVVWATSDGATDATDATATMHVVAIDAAGELRVIDSPLKLRVEDSRAGYFDTAAGTVADLRLENGALRTNYVWTSLDSRQSRRRHVATETLCLAAHGP